MIYYQIQNVCVFVSACGSNLCSKDLASSRTVLYSFRTFSFAHKSRLCLLVVVVVVVVGSGEERVRCAQLSAADVLFKRYRDVLGCTESFVTRWLIRVLCLKS